ncbi:MAG TPA: hydrogenase maturation protease [Acidimicrobiales bacterium]|jgi:hydrogenase maturation protease|nr:hydrogenase maturation protease [Acidimicrobiales bacterium]
MSGPTLVAGIGNVFLSDDAFGVEVARRLAARTLPEGVRAEDYGIRGIHLAYELLEGYDTLVLIDAVPLGQPPGTLAVIEPEVDADADVPTVDAHTMNPGVVLATLARLGGSVGHTVIVGCQPADLREGMGLSPAVAAAVDDATELCLEVLAAVAAEAPLANPLEGGTSG